MVADGAGTAVFPTLTGPMLVPAHDAYVGRALVENGVYAPTEFQAWRPYLPVGGIVLDVGANLGAHTMAFADVVGHTGMVIAVEPQRQLFHMLCGSAALQHRANVWPRWCACGKEPGMVAIPPLDYRKPNNFGGLSVSPVEGELPPEWEPVASVPIDAWGMPALDFLKIDVEGGEMDVLTGAEGTIMHARPVIACEVERHYPAILGWMLAHDYRPFWQTPLLGAQWASTRSKNLLCVPNDRHLPDPVGDQFPDCAAIAGIILPDRLIPVEA